ncbi:hypothetical protein KGF57_000454 [Candida theae]|uniref:Intimal thickness related receptor IRP domain-containing protein n=1 Tax=Candida theae TaxID=1198502 RepID=A0AAD5G0V8_9ASCO|nr:uncharacterized protein KGF57_000454 [Candida theae]KAI5967239.1 hypothetical protein KGF57_000454 [Candida theae]
MRLFHLLFLLITNLLQFSIAKRVTNVKPTTPYRKVFLNYQNNGICLLANETELTHFDLEFEFDRDNETVPILIFNYRDLFHFTNLPNFNDFLNHTYLEEQIEDSGQDKSLLLVDEGRKSVYFNLQVRDIARGLPKSVWYDVVTNKTTYVHYDVEEPGTYCIYMPLYTYDGELIQPTNYKASLSVEEFQPVSVYHDIASSLNIGILFGSSLLILSFLYPAIRAGKFDKLPPVVQQLSQLLAVHTAFTLIQLVLRLVYLFLPNDFIYTFTEVYFGYFANFLLRSWQKFIMSQVYFGLGYVNIPTKSLKFLKISKFIFQWAFIVGLFTEFIFDTCLDIPQPITGILYNGQPYSIYKKSILVNNLYANIVFNQSSDLFKYVFKYGSHVQLLCGLLLQASRFASGFYLAWKLRKKSNLAKPMFTTILIHLIAWTLFGRQTIYVLFIHLKFTGVFDVGEMLANMGHLIENYEVKWSALALVEILMLWFIWTAKTPREFDIVSEFDGSAKQDKKVNHAKRAKGSKKSTGEKKVSKNVEKRVSA